MIAQEKGINLQLQPDVRSFWNAATQLSFPSAMWRLPNEQTRYFLTSFLERPLQAKVDLDELPAGFSIAPFKNPQGSATYFLPADLLLTFDSKNRIVKTIQQPGEFDDDWQEFQQVLKNRIAKKASSKIQSEAVGDSEAERKRFVSTVENAIREINETDLLKVVLSRKKTFKINADRDVNLIFDKLCNAYPTAFISAVYLPHLKQIWLGASPETLVSQDEHGIFKTMSRAGTQPAYDEEKRPITEAETSWRQKEIEEQALVSRYIINCFKKVRVREYDEVGPRTAQAGNLMHLRSTFAVNTQLINFPELTSVMLELLHPTSAVCGMPKEAATELIYETENYDREFYSGYLGPVNIEQSTHLFVNLRTMKLQDSLATLYAGCGITADSNPEKEWIETEIKCQTIENAIFQLTPSLFVKE